MQFLLKTPLMCCCGQSPVGSCRRSRHAAALSSGVRTRYPALTRDSRPHAVFTTCEVSPSSCVYTLSCSHVEKQVTFSAGHSLDIRIIT